MDAEATKAKNRSKRKERGNQEKHNPEDPPSGEEDVDQGALSGTSTPKGKGKARRRRSSSQGSPKPSLTLGQFQEDVIDGFAIMSFKSFEDLEVRASPFLFCLHKSYSLLYSLSFDLYLD